MKLQRSTLALLFSAVLLGGLVYYFEIEGKARQEAVQAQERQLFDFTEDQIESLSVETPEKTLTLERFKPKEIKKSQESQWILKKIQTVPSASLLPAASPLPTATPSPISEVTPIPPASETPVSSQETLPAPETPTASPYPTTSPTSPPPSPETTPQVEENVPAENAAVAYLTNLLEAGQSQRTIIMSEPAKQIPEYGLNEPIATIEIKLKNGEKHRLLLGKPEANQNFLYAQVDPPENQAESVEVLIVSTDFENAVDRPVADWKQKEKPAEEKPETPDSNQSPDPSSEEKPVNTAPTASPTVPVSPSASPQSPPE
jgi:hypothetical protein